MLLFSSSASAAIVRRAALLTSEFHPPDVNLDKIAKLGPWGLWAGAGFHTPGHPQSPVFGAALCTTVWVAAHPICMAAGRCRATNLALTRNAAVLPIELLHGITFAVNWSALTTHSTRVAPDGFHSSMNQVWTILATAGRAGHGCLGWLKLAGLGWLRLAGQLGTHGSAPLLLLLLDSPAGRPPSVAAAAADQHGALGAGSWDRFDDRREHLGPVRGLGRFSGTLRAIYDV